MEVGVGGGAGEMVGEFDPIEKGIFDDGCDDHAFYPLLYQSVFEVLGVRRGIVIDDITCD